MTLRQLVSTIFVVTASVMAIGGASAVADPEATRRTLIWLGDEAVVGGGDGLVRLFLFLGALGVACGITTAAALGIHEFLLRRRD